MKKFMFVTTALVVFLALSSNAQINQGTILLGGGISGNSSKIGEGPTQTKTSWFSLTPSIGVAVKENKVIGIHLSYSRQQYPYSTPVSTELPMVMVEECFTGATSH